MSEQTHPFTNRAQWIIYSMLLFACFLLFKQSDLTHTYTSSYAYLNGHFADFYDYNKVYLGGNDYLPLLYAIFAIWFIPLKALDLLPISIGSSWQATSAVEIVWAKLLLTIFFVACLMQLRRLTHALGVKKVQGDEVAALFATSPFVIFAVFIFSQYDIISVYFVLLGLVAYFQRRFLKFVFWFSLAISLKYFAIIIFVPLLLMIEKRIKYLVIYFLAALVPTLVQIALYWHSDIFLGEIFTLAGGKAGDALGRGAAVLMAGLYALLCIYAFFKKMDFEHQKLFWHLLAIFSSLFAYDLMFSIVRWHPHWLVIIAPFICLTYLYVGHKRTLIVIELLAYLGFMVICVNTWEGNADIAMAYQGIFGGLLPNATLIGRDVLSSKWMPLSRIAFYIYLYSPLLLLAFEAGIKKIKSRSMKIQISSGQYQSSELTRGWFILRALVSTSSFVLLLLICIYLTPRV